jgi:hypothetical protein
VSLCPAIPHVARFSRQRGPGYVAHCVFEIPAVRAFNDHYGNSEARNLQLADDVTVPAGNNRPAGNNSYDGLQRLRLAFPYDLKLLNELPRLRRFIELRFQIVRQAESQGENPCGDEYVIAPTC